MKKSMLAVFSIMFIIVLVLLSGCAQEKPPEEKPNSFTLSGLTANKIIVTEAIPKYETGKDVTNYDSAFNKETISVKNGKATIELGESPVFIELDFSYPKATIADYKDSPFGIHGLNDYSSNVNDIGARFTRYAGPQGLVWDLIEKSKGSFDWVSDERYLETYQNNLKLFVTIKSANSWANPSDCDKYGSRKEKCLYGPPQDLDLYSNFIKKAVERYDADGIDDAPGSPRIDYYQVENEVDGGFWGGTKEDYTLLLKTTYKAIKEADPTAKVAIAGMAGRMDYYKELLAEIEKIKDSPNDRYFDVFDYHIVTIYPNYKGNVFTAEGSPSEVKVTSVQEMLNEYGYGDVDVFITEMSAYDGDPEGNFFGRQSETQQAIELLKLYVYPIANDVKKIGWVTLTEWHNYAGKENSYFDNVGLINNPQNDGQSHKKLAYYTYKLMTEKLEGSDWDNIETISDGTGNIYVYKFYRKDLGKPVYVAWKDYSGEESKRETAAQKPEAKSGTKGKCGDGVCGPVEKQKGACPEDCK